MSIEAEDIPPAWHYASYRSLLGELQRGHGIAVVRLRGQPEHAQIVYECTSRDTRWDWQVDNRRGYLARLLRDLRLDLAPLIAQLRACGPDRPWPHRDPTNDDNQFRLTVGILETLARAGNAQASEALRGYVRDGLRWVEVLEVISEEWPVEWWDDLWEAAAARLDLDDTTHLFPSGKPWRHWRGRDPSLDARLDDALPNRCDSPATGNDLTETSDADLIDLLRAPDTDRGTLAMALRQIRRRGHAVPELLELVEQLRAARAPGLTRALHTLGPLVVPAARTWAADSDHPLFHDAPDLLAEHGDEQDIPTLLTALDRLADQWCGYDQLTAGLTRIVAALPPNAQTDTRALLVRRLRWLAIASPHSYERPSYLRSLLLLDWQHTLNNLPAYLFDCEPEVRQLAAENIPLTDNVRSLLTLLRDDPIEDDDVKHAVARRL
ncbi:hypothetical protein [Pseudofrankia saprophytica]|uniref:hypothetical protein n=1 Tax=Pseudofrankia saprophytica TaxID=298655 RepID=UPI00056B1154|nr:hypothetical protein [Pseudofrankia saprophytica]